MPRVAYSLRQPRESDIGFALELSQRAGCYIVQPTKPGQPFRVECRGQTVFTAPDVRALVGYLRERADR